MSDDARSKMIWEKSFEDQISLGAFNTAPVESLVRSVSYYLRDRKGLVSFDGMHFLEMGCGAGPNLIWLARKGIHVSGIDISPTALRLCRQAFETEGLSAQLSQLVEGSVEKTPFPDVSFDGIIESCVFQHLSREARRRAFNEVGRLLKPGGIFVGLLLDQGHTVFQSKKADQVLEDPGTLVLEGNGPMAYLTNIGISHFFQAKEFRDLLPGFSMVDPCLTTWKLPTVEAKKRGYSEYIQSMWNVVAIK